MSDIKLNISVKEENNILFKRCIRKLLVLLTLNNVKDLTLLIVRKLTALLSKMKGKQPFASPTILQINLICFIIFKIKPNFISTCKYIPVSAQLQTAGKNLSISYMKIKPFPTSHFIACIISPKHNPTIQLFIVVHFFPAAFHESSPWMTCLII